MFGSRTTSIFILTFILVNNLFGQDKIVGNHGSNVTDLVFVTTVLLLKKNSTSECLKNGNLLRERGSRSYEIMDKQINLI